MKVSNFILAAFILLLSFSAKAEDGAQCEPSLIFPEVFFLESGKCFSYLEADSVYFDKDFLAAYLNSVDGGHNQNIYRYLYYLRENEYLPALMTLMFMVNTGSLPDSVKSIDSEFNNIITGALRKQKDEDGKTVPFSGSKPEEITVTQLSDNFFSALAFIASYADRMGTGIHESDETMLNRAFLYILSNIQAGIDWRGDIYLNDLFNKFIQMKKNNLTGGFISLFFYYMRESGPVPSFRDYSELRKTGAIGDIKIKDDAENRIKQQNITLFFAKHADFIPKIEYVPGDEPVRKTDSECAYLNERGDWIKNLSDKDPAEYYFNESVKIAEQCPGVFSLPFEITPGKIFIYNHSYWIADIAIMLDYLISGKAEPADSQMLLESAVASSLLKSLGSRDRTLAMDILYYTNATGNAGKLIKSMFAGQLPSIISNENQEPVTQAAETLSDLLF